jgi:hypothetical protein
MPHRGTAGQHFVWRRRHCIGRTASTITARWFPDIVDHPGNVAKTAPTTAAE